MTKNTCSYCGEQTTELVRGDGVAACEHCYAEGAEQSEGAAR